MLICLIIIAYKNDSVFVNIQTMFLVYHLMQFNKVLLEVLKYLKHSGSLIEMIHLPITYRYLSFLSMRGRAGSSLADENCLDCSWKIVASFHSWHYYYPNRNTQYYNHYQRLAVVNKIISSPISL